MTRRPLVRSTVLALTLGASTPALASPSYPDAVQRASGSPCPPPCTLCHETDRGGYGTAVAPFARSMMDVGHLEAEAPDLVAPALEALAAARTDSDGDGVDDATELERGRDPNQPGESDLCGPRYGCGARVEPDGSLDGAALGLAMGALLLMRAHGRTTGRAPRRAEPRRGRRP